MSTRLITSSFLPHDYEAGDQPNGDWNNYSMNNYPVSIHHRVESSENNPYGLYTGEHPYYELHNALHSINDEFNFNPIANKSIRDDDLRTWQRRASDNSIRPKGLILGHEDITHHDKLNTDYTPKQVLYGHLANHFLPLTNYDKLVARDYYDEHQQQVEPHIPNKDLLPDYMDNSDHPSDVGYRSLFAKLWHDYMEKIYDTRLTGVIHTPSHSNLPKFKEFAQKEIEQSKSPQFKTWANKLIDGIGKIERDPRKINLDIIHPQPPW